MKNRFLIKNKKGDIPVTILVIGVIAVCALALISFYSSNLKFGGSFEGVSLVQKVLVNSDEYDFYVSKGVSPDLAKDNLELDDNFFVEEDYFLVEKYETKIKPRLSLSGWKKQVFVFSVKYYRD